MASGEEKEAKDTEDTKEEQKDEGSGEGAKSWIMSGLKVGAALKIGAVLGVTTLGATALGAVAIGAYAAMKLAQQFNEAEPPQESECGSDLKGDDAKSEDAASLVSPKASPPDGLETKEEPQGSLVDKLNDYHHARVAASAAKRVAVRDLVENARQPLGRHLIKSYESLVDGELKVAAFDRLITRQIDERRLLLPLVLNPEMWEVIDASGSVIEMPGYFCIRRVNLDSFSFGTSPLDSSLSGSYLCPELLRKFWMENIKELLRKEKLLDSEYSIEWNAGSIDLNIENPIKGYADMLCIKIIPCMKVEKGGVMITIIAESVTSLQKPPALSSIPQENLWQQSWEEEAVLEMETLEKDGGCRLKCLAILDNLQSSQPQLKMLSLYPLMTVLLKVCQEETEWEEEMLAERLLDLLKALEGHLGTGRLMDYFDEKVDIFSQCCPPEAMSESQRWLSKVLASEDQIADLFIKVE